MDFWRKSFHLMPFRKSPQSVGSFHQFLQFCYFDLFIVCLSFSMTVYFISQSDSHSTAAMSSPDCRSNVSIALIESIGRSSGHRLLSSNRVAITAIHAIHVIPAIPAIGTITAFRAIPTCLHQNSISVHFSLITAFHEFCYSVYGDVKTYD